MSLTRQDPRKDQPDRRTRSRALLTEPRSDRLLAGQLRPRLPAAPYGKTLRQPWKVLCRIHRGNGGPGPGRVVPGET